MYIEGQWLVYDDTDEMGDEGNLPRMVVRYVEPVARNTDLHRLRDPLTGATFTAYLRELTPTASPYNFDLDEID